MPAPMLTLLWVLAVTDPAIPTSSMTDVLLNQGVLGVALIAVAGLCWLNIKRGWQREDALLQRLNSLEDQVRTDFMPALIRSTDAVTRCVDVLAQVSDPPSGSSSRRS